MSMKKLSWILALVVGLALGFCYQSLHSKPAPVETETHISEQGVDTFGLKLFQAALRENNGNVIVAPCAMAALLHETHSIVQGKAKEELKHLQLPEKAPFVNVNPSIFAGLFADDAVDFLPTEDARAFIRVPFNALPRAFGLINTLVENANCPAIGFTLGNDSLVNRSSRLVGIVSTKFDKPFESPFFAANNATMNFDNADGRAPGITMMRSRGNYRTTRAEDGSWEAVALPYQKELKTGSSLYFIAILPRGSARTMAETITPEQLGDIRRALSRSKPQYGDTALPELRYLPHTATADRQLQRLNIHAIYTQKDLFPAVRNDSLVFDTILQQHEFSIKAAPTPKLTPVPSAGGNGTTIDRPFIWLVCDLNSDTPPFLIGLIENL